MKPTDADHLGRLLASAETSFILREQRRFDLVIHELVTHPDVGGWRSEVETIVHSQIRDSVGAAWKAGWQPADLIRAVSRRFTGVTVALARDAVADELRAYAQSTVDPRWFSQLQTAEAQVWWPNDRTYLRARIEHPRAMWVTIMVGALELLCLVRTARRLERLGPIPGEYRPPAASGAAGGGTGEAREKVLARIRAMLAKAESTTSEAEAAAFTAAAQERMARYSIDMAMVEANDPGGGGAIRPLGRRIGIDQPYESPKAMLLDAVAVANRCSAVWTRDLGFGTVIGYDVDVLATETLFTSLLLQATTALERSEMIIRDPRRARSRAFRHSFLVAYASRIRERLTLITATQTQAASSESDGGHLLPVLASRKQAVDDRVAELFPTLKHHATVRYSDAAGWSSGTGAADRANLHGQELAGDRRP